MMLLFQKGILFGIMISFMLGPAFFILIETSIKKGFRSAIFLDLGILLSDAIYLLAAFFVAEKINLWLSTNKALQYIAGSIFIILGLFSIRKNYLQKKEADLKIKDLEAVDTDNSNLIVYPFKLIVKGLGLNAINPGVLVFWIAACTYATNELKLSNIQLLTFFGITLLTMFTVDIFKIYFSSKLKEKLNSSTLAAIGMGIGCLLVFFGVAIFLKDVSF
jgi:threonine/homoserine/homoserine lactone efflux protein|tara:strand:- start:132 stop:788 length:657 start_codon:yes stop_codon:yes gene_type:complete